MSFQTVVFSLETHLCPETNRSQGVIQMSLKPCNGVGETQAEHRNHTHLCAQSCLFVSGITVEFEREKWVESGSRSGGCSSIAKLWLFCSAQKKLWDTEVSFLPHLWDPGLSDFLVTQYQQLQEDCSLWLTSCFFKHLVCNNVLSEIWGLSYGRPFCLLTLLVPFSVFSAYPRKISVIY